MCFTLSLVAIEFFVCFFDFKNQSVAGNVIQLNKRNKPERKSQV